jgi:protein gp37
MGKTSIQWTDATWSPVTGCSKISPGCTNCYAERMDRRQMWKRTPDGFKPWTAQNAEYNVRLHPERLDEPLHWRKPRMVFVCSVADLFHELVPDEFIDRVFAVIALSPKHTFQILTKRAKRMYEYLTWPGRRDAIKHEGEKMKPSRPPEHWYHISDWNARMKWPLQNVWLMVSAEDQRRFDERVPVLVSIPAVVHGVSLEPLLGPINIGPYRPEWAIVGGESGPGARPMDVQWARDIVRQCEEAHTACFVKQMGRRVTGADDGFLVDRWLLSNGDVFLPPIIGLNARMRPPDAVGFHLFDGKGGKPHEWPEDLRVRQMPAVR